MRNGRCSLYRSSLECPANRDISGMTANKEKERTCVNNTKTGTLTQTHRTTLMPRRAPVPFLIKEIV